MATAPSEPPPKHVKLRYRALAYVRRIGRHREPPRTRTISRRSFVDTGASIRLSDSNGMGFPDSGGLRPVVRLSSKRSFADSGNARSLVRISSRSFGDSTGSKSAGPARLRNESVFTTGEIKPNRKSGRKKPRKNREKRGQRRHRLLAALHDHGGHQLRLFCRCCVEQEAYNPAEAPSFHWGVGYPAVDLSSVDARASSFDSGFDFICASPVSCPLPPGLESTRTLPTTLQLRSRDGIGSGKLTFNSGNSFSSTGIKRKAPSDSSGYPSYSPTTPPSPFLNDFAGAGTFNNTRVRSRVSVGCNGWYMNDDDAVNKGWYRRGSSGEVKLMNLPQLPEVFEESSFDRDSPKRQKMSPRGELTYFHSSPRGSLVLLSPNGSVSSTKDERDWLVTGGNTLLSLPLSSSPSTARLSYTISPPLPASSLQPNNPQEDSKNDDYAPPTKRRRSIGSSPSSSGGFDVASMNEVDGESFNFEKSLRASGSTSLTARFSASLRLTRSLSPRTFRGLRRNEVRRSSCHSARRSRRRMFHLGSRTSVAKSASPPSVQVKTACNPSILFIDCPP
ncbi:hypothetical protein PHMEG_00024420 [Phytophthora megakarya]|uniref:Uncharacterized protein n=1 Tax=Phytophthora megakarya TaxID=4795 RepID=A0A225VFU0_9STRA|nr:hypothetical protein PHMEG_00024420 [Phytophthora megakarya]